MSATALGGLQTELGFQILPLFAGELNLAAEVILDEDFLRIGEVNRRAAALHAAQLDPALLERTNRCGVILVHDSSFSVKDPKSEIYCAGRISVGTSFC